MRSSLITLGIALSLASAGALAQATPRAGALGPAVGADGVLCAGIPGKCPRFKHVLSFPAHALSQSSFGTFGLHTRGVEWTGGSGAMSLTMRRPKDFTGDQVRLLLFYEVADDSAGQIQFNVTPVSLKHGSGFETYGAFSTVPIDAPESPTILHERAVLITGGNGWNPAVGPWWYFEISRPGSFQGKLRLMSVALEY